MPHLVYDTNTENYESARVEEAPFDEALNLLAADNLSLIPASINARLRRELGPKAFISQNGNNVQQGILRTPSGLIYFTNNSPVLAHPRKATAAHRREKPFMATRKDITRALEDAVQVTRASIPVDELATDPVGQFLFQEEAGPYGAFLRERYIHFLPINVSLVEGEADQLWFSRLDSGSGLYGGNWGLDGGSGVRGVREVGAAGAAPNLTAYSPEQLSRALEKLKIPGLEAMILKEPNTQ